MSMKVSTFIKRYAEKHTEVDQKFCPKFGIEVARFNQKLGNYYKIYTPWNGKIYINECPKELAGNWRYRNTHHARSYNFDGVFCKNIGHGVLEVSYIYMDAHWEKTEGKKRNWQYESECNAQDFPKRIFIDRETMMPYNKYGDRIWKAYDGRYYNRMLVKWLSSINTHGRYSPYNLQKTLADFCGVSQAYIGWRNSLCEIRNFWNLAAFIQKVKERPKSDLAVKLSAYKFPEREYDKHTIEFCIIDDEYAVFRIFMCEVSWSPEIRGYKSSSKGNEKVRVYISSKGKVTLMEKDVNNTYRISGKPLNNIVWTHGNMSVDTVGYEKMSEWLPIKWNMDLIKDDSDSKDFNPITGIRKLVNLLRHPAIEKLYKMGYKNIAEALIYNECVAKMKQVFYIDKLKESERNVCRMLGVNKEILNMLERMYSNETNNYRRRDISIAGLKEIFGKEDISSLSKETIDLYSTGFTALGYRDWREILGNYRYRWNRPKFEYTPTDSERALIEKLFRLEQTEQGIIASYIDARNIYNYLSANNRPEIDWSDFRHIEDVNTLHDNLLALQEAERAERQRLNALREEERRKEYQKKFEKLQDDRQKKFECIGDRFSIVIPKSLGEITTEGSTLHHCVGGYLDSHAQGNTNILFLRDSKNPTVPFYTIEVDPKDYVVQIHGKNNRWLGNNPEAISFVWKWITERGLTCEKYKLLNTGAGYGKGKDQVSESYLVA